MFQTSNFNLKKTCIIQFSHLFLQQKFKQFFKIRFCVLAEEIMTAKIAEVINYGKISVGEQSALSV